MAAEPLIIVPAEEPLAAMVAVALVPVLSHVLAG
jgi:hypothetical protein